MTICLDVEKDEKYIPFAEVMKLADAFGFDEGVPNNKRLAILWLALTGARPSEIEHRTISEIQLDCWIWKPRKNQKGGPRIERLPLWFLQELQLFLNKGKYRPDDLFGITGNSLTRWINGKIRKKLGGKWIDVKPTFRVSGPIRFAYVWQLKNLRHNFQTLEWWNAVEKYGHDLALMKVSRKMKHSCKEMTGLHYIENVDGLDLNRYKGKNMGEILWATRQRTLCEFL